MNGRMCDEVGDRRELLARFNRLVLEMSRGGAGRTAFHRWEVDLLVDMAACSIPEPHRLDVLEAYQKAGRWRIEHGIWPPLKLSEFLHSQG